VNSVTRRRRQFVAIPMAKRRYGGGAQKSNEDDLSTKRVAPIALRYLEKTTPPETEMSETDQQYEKENGNKMTILLMTKH
jgi:hypothetical protein